MKKIAMIIPSLLLTSCLFGCNKNPEVDPFVIASEEKFNEAIGLTAKDIKYTQVKSQQIIISSSSVYIVYQEDCVSPTVYYLYQNVYSGSVGEPTERYVRKDSDDNYLIREKDNTGAWIEREGGKEDFKNPPDLSIKGILTSYNITYDYIKNDYDKDLRRYCFDAEREGQIHSFVLSFYKNRLTYYSNEYHTSSITIFNSSDYTYSEITPDFPDIPES